MILGSNYWGSNAMYQESLADVVVAKLEVLVELSSSRVPGLVLLQHWLWSFKFEDTKRIETDKQNLRLG